ncbi:hypothetical protein AB0G64_09335 [Streptomyces longwoodensis]|uniref:hypothetical protein n=1 Tax=Streptomyces longwoodensis TaxID=68231 RepID=UPI00340A2686
MDSGTLFIRSTLDLATRAPACLIEWGPIQARLTPDVVHATARDLMAAAAAAETDIALLAFLREDVGVDNATALAHMLGHVRERRPVHAGKTALRIEAVAGADTGRPYVHIARGSMKGSLTPDEARAMAQQWTHAAAAAQIDAGLRYALGEWDHLTPDDIENLFTILQSVQR